MMNYPEKLLDGQKVEWKALGEVCKISTGKLNANAKVEGGKYPFFTCDAKPYQINHYAFDTSAILISGNGSQLGHINSYEGKFNAYQRTYVLSDFKNILKRFLMHYLKANLKSYISICSKKGSVPYIVLPVLENFQIPIPPLEIQKEIVKILDKMTELEATLEATLEAELALRAKQYRYYRDLLLDCENPKNPFSGSLKVEWKTLGEVAQFTYGHIAKSKDSGSARFIRISDIDTNGKLIVEDKKFIDVDSSNEKYLLKKNDVLMARTGATYGKTMIFNEDYAAIYVGFLIKINLNINILNPKYYWHFAQSSLFWVQAEKLVSGGGQQQFNANVLKNVYLPIPPLETQAKIVEILDKFDTLTHSISEGLPKEIALRRKQYEYYRGQLLNFPDN